jgi:DNA-binding NarL/FixJ family response regulator
MDRHRMLLVEDHQETRTLLRRILVLTLAGWEVAEAATVEEGLAQLDPPPDCVLLDLELPDGPGEAVLRKVRQDHLQTRVVVNTGTNDQARLTAVSDLGPDAVLQKPLDSVGLRRVHRAAIAQGDKEAACP